MVGSSAFGNFPVIFTIDQVFCFPFQTFFGMSNPGVNIVGVDQGSG
jgi:hypothetical protein